MSETQQPQAITQKEKPQVIDPTLNSKFFTVVVALVALTVLCIYGRISGELAFTGIMGLATGYPIFRHFTKQKGA